MNSFTSNIKIMNYLEWSVEDSQPESMKEFLEQLKFFLPTYPHTSWGIFMCHVVKTMGFDVLNLS